MSVSNPISALPQARDPAAHVDSLRQAAEPPSHVQHDAVSPEQVAPLPKTEVDQQHVDRHALIAEILKSYPSATPDDVVRRLADRQIQVSAVFVMSELARIRGSNALA